MKTKTTKTHVSEEKKQTVKELVNLIKSKKTILIASIKNLPASQFQEISKKIKGKAIVKVPKKNLILRAMDNSGNDLMKNIKEQIKSDVVILFSDEDAFDLAYFLLENISPAKAKAGQEAPEDIIIQPGPTDLVPGPAISELGALGIQIQIDKGKINIKTAKTIVKKGNKISQGAADIMFKLNIKPFSIGFIPLCALDVKEGKFYSDIKIDKEENLNKLKSAYRKALLFAIEIGYPTRETIKLIIGKAGRQAKALKEKFMLQNNTPEIKLEGEEK